MLRGLQKASSNWLGKVVMAAVVTFLVVSFAIWGIGDIFHGFGQSNVASVGSVDISIEQFREAYNNQLQRIGQQLHRAISSEQARALGLDRRVLSQMIAETALDERAHQMGLSVTDAEIAKRITRDPAFQGPTGKFDRSRFEALIREAGFTEQHFVQIQRQVTLRRQLANTITGDLVLPKAMLEALNRYRNQQRSIDYVVLGPPQAGTIAPPSQEVLSKYFDAHKLEFRAPEYRKAVLIELSPEGLAQWMTISDADARKYYQDHHADYVTPERRHLRQIVFPNEAEAQAARDKIAKGTSFSAIAAERHLKDQDIDLGTVTKNSMVDPTVANAAFSLKLNEVSQPIKGQFGIALVQVLSIEPQKVQPYEQVADKIKHTIALQRAKDQIFDLRDKIEDARAAGSTLPEIASKLKLPSRNVEVDRSGHAQDGSPVKMEAEKQVLQAIFTTQVGVDADPVQFGENSFVYYSVTGITPAHDRKLADIKQKVEQHWREEQITARLKKQAGEMVDRLKSGNALAQLAQAKGLKVETADGLTRLKPDGPITRPVLEAVFQTDKNAVGSAAGQGPDQVVFRVTKVTTPPLDTKSEDAKKLDQALRASVANTMLGEYLAQVEHELGTRVNQSAINQAIGANQPE